MPATPTTENLIIGFGDQLVREPATGRIKLKKRGGGIVDITALIDELAQGQASVSTDVMCRDTRINDRLIFTALAAFLALPYGLTIATPDDQSDPFHTCTFVRPIAAN